MMTAAIDAEDLALGQLELAEQVTAVLDLHARDRWLGGAELLDRVAELGGVFEAAIGHVELGEGDRAALADLLGVVVGAGDRHPFLLGGEVHQRLEGRLHRRIVDTLVGA